MVINKEEIVDVLNRIYVVEPEAAENLYHKIKLDCNFRFTDSGSVVKCEGNSLGVLDLLNGLFKTRHKVITARRDEDGNLIHFIVARYEAVEEKDSLISKTLVKSELNEAKRHLLSLLIKRCEEGLSDVEAKLMHLLSKDEGIKGLLEGGL